VLFRETTYRVLVAQAARIEDRLRAEHKWRNRTGTAERALHAGVVDLGPDAFRVVAGYDHTAPYSVYLELAMQQRWAVLEPVMRSQWPATARAVAAAVRTAAAAGSVGGGGAA
jgi:hypothetical protein